MKRVLWLALLFVVGIIALNPVSSRARRSKVPLLRLSTTTSTVDSGLLDYILPVFEKKYGVKVEAVSVGTGKALKLGESGDVDVILVHARGAEEKFVADGFGVNRRDVMYNDFLLVGPASDPAGIKGGKDAVAAFKMIAEKENVFISRADKSGTDMKEKEIWKKAGIAPSGKWFLESGQGMGATLNMAAELDACTIVDRATFLSYKEKVGLAPLVEGDPILFNPYGVIAVNPKRYPSTHYDLAIKFIEWITSDEGQKLIASYKVEGTQLFIPDADGGKP